MKRYGKTLKSRNGFSIVMVLIVITVLIILTGSLLLLTIGNSKTSQKVRSVIGGYYDLDKAGELVLQDIDKKIQEAELKTIDYMKNEKFKDSQLQEAPIDSTKQKYFFRRWMNEVYLKSSVLPQNGDAYKKLSSGMDNLTIQDLIDNAKLNADKYNENIAKYLPEVFGRVYYVYLQDSMSRYSAPVTKSVNGKSIGVKIACVNAKKYSNISVEKTWADFKPQEGDVVFDIELTNEAGKKLKIKANSTIPVYDTIKKKTTSKAARGNPIWANAVTAGGSIKFSKGDNINIYGDLFSSDNKQEGVSITDATVNVYGNVYSKGNLKVSSSNTNKISNVTVKEYKDVDITNKKKLFGNNYLFEINKKLKEKLEKNRFGEADCPQGTVPLLYSDTSGGNVYCNDLLMDNSAAKNSKITINKNLWTKGSIINDSIHGLTEININKNYIGITPVKIRNNMYKPSDDKGNYGSCVINNIYDLNNMNKIYLGGKVIVPGIIPVNLGNMSYPSAESMGANIWDKNKIVEAYRQEAYKDNIPLHEENLRFRFVDNGILKETDLPIHIVDITDTSKATYALTLYTNDRLIDTGNRYSSLNGVITNIELGDNIPSGVVEGYCEGTSIVLKKSVNKYKCAYANDEASVQGYGNNRRSISNTNNVSGSLVDIFKQKTLGFGSINNDFTNSIDLSSIMNKEEEETGIKYFDTLGGTLNLSKDISGIVYSEGDLHIKGTGTFKGAIICKGTVFIEETPTIKYDEMVIATILKMKSPARDFFKPGEIGEYNMSIGLGESAGPIVNKRSATYKIVDWKQK